MNVLNRLKLELSNQEYFTDEEYTQFLIENDLESDATYDKATMQRDLLLTVLDVLEAVSNDIDIMRRVTTEFTDLTTAYKSLESRISKVRDKIASIPEVGEEYNCFSLMYTNKQRDDYVNWTGHKNHNITNSDIDTMLGGN